MSKRNRSKHTDNPSVLFYLFLLGLLGYFLYSERAWFIAHYRPLAAAAALVVLVFGLLLIRRYRFAATLQAIDKMSGHEFERYLVRMFKRLGFKAHNVGGGGGDYGADLIIEKDGVTVAVQAKNYLHGKVGNDAVQQAIAGATYYNCDQAMVVTNARFTKAAKEQARGCGVFPVTLWDRGDIRKVIEG